MQSSSTSSAVLKDSVFGRSSPINEFRDVAIAVAFNYKKDPQRGIFVQSSFDYVKDWYDSIHKHPGMKGVLLTDLYDEDTFMRYTTDQVEFIYIDSTTHPSFTQIENSVERTINDQKYFVAQWFLKATKGQYDYVLLTDVSDVIFQHNPFQFMRAVDRVMPQPQIYAGEEFKRNGGSYMTTWMKQCFNIDKYNSAPKTFFNAGLIGAQTPVLAHFLKKITHLLSQSPTEVACNMAAFGRVLHEEYKANVISGYPFNTEFKGDPMKQSDAFIKHK